MDELSKVYTGKVDFVNTRTKEPGVAKDMQKKYSVQILPTVVMLDDSGKVVFTKVGIRDKASYRKELEEALNKVAK